MIPIYDPTTQVTTPTARTRQPYPNNQIPSRNSALPSRKPSASSRAKRWDSVEPSCPTTAPLRARAAYISNNYLETQGTQVYPVNKLSVKGDKVFNNKHRISGYWGWDREHETYGADGPPTLPGLYSNYNDLTQSSDVFRFSWTWTFAPNKINYFYAGGNDWNQDHKPPQEYIGRLAK